MAGWQSSNLVIKHPDKSGYERCAACNVGDVIELEEARRAVQDGKEGALDWMQAIEQRIEAAYWRTAVWYARRKHIANCTLQTPDNRAQAQALLDRNAESNRRAEQKRKGKEKEQKEQSLLNSSNDNTAFHYKDWVAPLMGDSSEMTAMHPLISTARLGNAMTNEGGSTPSGSASPLPLLHNQHLKTATPSVASRLSLPPTTDDENTSMDGGDEHDSNLLLAASNIAYNNNSSRPHPSSSSVSSSLLQIHSHVLEREGSSSSTSTSSSSPSSHTSANGDDANNNNGENGENIEEGEGESGEVDSLGYPSKLPFWVSANLVSRHPLSKDKETCVQCLRILEEERDELGYGFDDPARADRYARLSRKEWDERVEEADQKIKDSYWLTNGNGRFRHMSECIHQSEDTQDKARIRLQRYLAMARQRMKARHEREKLEKRKKKSLLLGGLSVDTALAASASSAAGASTGGNGTAASARHSSADVGTPDSYRLQSKKQTKRQKNAAMVEDLRALSIMPGKKRGDTVVKGRANLMNTYDHEGYTEDELDLADMPPPMLHDSGSERSPSMPPETVKTPHSISFRVTDEPYIYIKDSLPHSGNSLSGTTRDENFFAASASIYAASQENSNKIITAQTFFDTPTDHSSGIGGRKRSPHLYLRNGDGKRRRRNAVDSYDAASTIGTGVLGRRPGMPLRTVKRPRHAF